jgi:hypothetical protein
MGCRDRRGSRAYRSGNRDRDDHSRGKHGTRNFPQSPTKRSQCSPRGLDQCVTSFNSASMRYQFQFSLSLQKGQHYPSARRPHVRNLQSTVKARLTERFDEVPVETIWFTALSSANPGHFGRTGDPARRNRLGGERGKSFGALESCRPGGCSRCSRTNPEGRPSAGGVENRGPGGEAPPKTRQKHPFKASQSALKHRLYTADAISLRRLLAGFRVS